MARLSLVGAVAVARQCWYGAAAMVSSRGRQAGRVAGEKVVARERQAQGRRSTGRRDHENIGIIMEKEVRRRGMEGQ